MARPFVRRALKRAGVLPPRVPRDPEAARPVPPPRIFLPGEAEDAGPVDFRALFGRSAPVELEIGTGKGRFLMEAAAARPDRDFLGIEIEREYALLVTMRAAKRGLANLRVESLDGKEFVKRRLRPGALAVLHVYFPDPWPKKRHWKRRLFDAAFATAAAFALEPGGLLRVASDHPGYWSVITEVLAAEPLLVPVAEAETGPWSCGTNYELKFAASGRPVFKAVFRRR